MWVQTVWRTTSGSRQWWGVLQDDILLTALQGGRVGAMMDQKARILLVMGVAGSGKSTLAASLAEALGWDLIEADEYHPPGNIEKMASGIALTDADRRPWLESLRREIDARLAAGRCGVLACSALREEYRQILRRGHEERVPIIYLKGDAATIESRLKARRGHYMGPRMLASQLETLEEPGDAVVVSTELPPTEAVALVRRELGDILPVRPD